MEELQGTRAEEPRLAIHFQLLEIWERVLGAKVPGIDSSFFDLGGHSLLLASMMDEVEAATGKYVSIARFLNEPTVRHLAECLVVESERDEEVTLVQAGSEAVPPLFYFHGDILGGGFYARRLAAHLGRHQPVYTVPPVQLGDDSLPAVSEIAAQRIRLIRQKCPHGPYIIGGFCIGALTAYEVARQLAEQGEEVRGVFLINPQLAGRLMRSHLKLVQKLAHRRGHDVRATVETFVRTRQKLERFLDLWHAPVREKAQFIVRNGCKLFGAKGGAVEEPALAAPALAGDGNSREAWLLSAFQWIATAHEPKPYDGEVTILMTEDQERETPHLAEEWRKRCPRLRVEYIPGEHLTCITRFGHILADKLRLGLARISSALSV
jgi:pimeloyl-ACP methyl ester carboxylesterase/acyl carrier protein